MGCRKLQVNDYFRMTDSASGTDVPYYALADANKNITDYVDASGTIQAHYEYSPFGKITVQNGTMQDDFDYRFSSEVYDDSTGLSYYNYRYYSPELGRWLSRDPIGETGGVNLYGFVENNVINITDAHGKSATLIVGGVILGGLILYNLWEHFHTPEDASGVYGVPAQCPSPQLTRFIQVAQGGYGSWNTPFVDTGGPGFGGETPTGSALYPEGPSPGTFSDKPGALAGPVEFEVCRVCVCPDGTIASFGPCAKWKNGDSGELDWDFEAPSITFVQTVENEFPGTFHEGGSDVLPPPPNGPNIMIP